MDKPVRILGKMVDSGDMTVEKCVQLCSNAGYYLAGVEVRKINNPISVTEKLFR